MRLNRSTDIVATRAVMVHYHLFKNGGTSIERMLRDAFGESWASWDKESSAARISGAEMQAWIESHPQVRAVSSHQVVPPVPRGDLVIMPIVFLREPILRARSAWMFEWQKQPGRDTPKGSLKRYIETKFAQSQVGVIANFQVSRLCNGDYEDPRQRMGLHDETRLEAACRFIDTLPFVGVVDRFAESLELLEAASQEHFPDFVAREHRENVLDTSKRSPDERRALMREEIGAELYDELCLRNRLDSKLYTYALERFEAMRTRFRASLDD